MGFRKLREKASVKLTDLHHGVLRGWNSATSALWFRRNGFKRNSLRGLGKMPVPDSHNPARTETPVSMWVRKPLPPPHTWSIVGRRANAYLFLTPQKRAYFLKLAGGRTNSGPRASEYAGINSVKNLVKVLKSGLKSEIPVGLLLTAERHDYLISEPVRGLPMEEALKLATKGERREIALGIAEQLADWHNKGFAHGHVYDNILVYSTIATIIDPTRITTKKQVSAIGLFMDRDVAGVNSYFAKDKELSDLFTKTYYQLRGL